MTSSYSDKSKIKFDINNTWLSTIQFDSNLMIVETEYEFYRLPEKYFYS